MPPKLIKTDDVSGMIRKTYSGTFSKSHDIFSKHTTASVFFVSQVTFVNI